MRLLPSCVFFAIVFLFVCGDDVVTVEKRARCVARCTEYDQTKKSSPYSCPAPSCTMECALPCMQSYQSLSECQASCTSVVCSESCAFRFDTSDATPEKARLPITPGRLRLVEERLVWERSNYQFYKNDADRHMGVIFLLLGSRVVLLANGSIDESHLNWQDIRQTFETSVSVKDVENMIKLHCDYSYVFKVAAFNELGARAYQMSDSYTVLELLNKSCNAWYPLNSSPPSYCQSNTDFKRTQLNLHDENSEEQFSLYKWNDDCSNLKATRVIKWKQPKNIPDNVCYEIYVKSNKHAMGSKCDMNDRVYYKFANESEVTLEMLEPNCNLYVSVYAGTLSRSVLSDDTLNFKLNLKIASTSPVCGQPYGHINFTADVQFNETSELYIVVLSWVNPPGPVDSFSLDAHIKGQFKPSIKIPSVHSSFHVYKHRLNVSPNRCFERITLLPTYELKGFQSSTISGLCTSSLRPDPPFNVTTQGAPNSVTVRWQEPLYIHSHYPIIGYVVKWSSLTEHNDGNLDSSSAHVESVSTKSTEYTVTGLLSNHLYHFQVSALSDAGNSTFTKLQGQRTSSVPSESGVNVALIAGPVAALVFVVVLIVIIAAVAIGSEKRKYNQFLTQLELDTFRPPQLPLVEAIMDEDPDEWEIEPRNLSLQEVLGEGFFGIVLKAEVRHPGPPITAITVRPLGTLCPGKERKIKPGWSKFSQTVVACKMLKEMGTMEDQKDILEEIKLMKRIAQHKHIVSILGCITLSHPVCLIVEFCEHGDLLQYLRNSRPAWLLAVKNRNSKQINNPYSAVPGTLRDTEGYVPMAAAAPSTSEKTAEGKNADEQEQMVDMEEKSATPRLSSFDLLSFSRQIALGMEYLAEKELVHRDLACRNVLVAENKLLKISDFGLTRAVYKDATYTQKTKGRLPLKWMAVESITDRIFTTQSDIWSYGIVLWEICTLGGFPYPTISNEQLLKKLRENYRMERPENCSEDLYSVMLQCWHPDPDQRPSFSSLVAAVDAMMNTQKAGLYVDLNFDSHGQYWMSVSELGDSDSDAEPDIPFQETHLRQSSFAQKGSENGTTLGIAKQALKLSGVNEEEIENDPFLRQVSNKSCYSPSEHALAENGVSMKMNGATQRQENGNTTGNGYVANASGHVIDHVTSV